MTIYTIQGINFDSNVYIITGSIPTIIDTGTGLFQSQMEKSIRKIIDPKSIKQIILTHEHYDHCGGAGKIFDLTGSNATILSHKEASVKIEKGESMFAELLGGSMPKITIDQKVIGGEKITIGDNEFVIIHTPGHTPGCMCFYDEKTKTLFSGDTVFAYGSFGRTDFPGGNTKDLIKSIKTLSAYDIENLYPGHEDIIEGKGNEHISLSYKNICQYG